VAAPFGAKSDPSHFESWRFGLVGPVSSMPAFLGELRPAGRL